MTHYVELENGYNCNPHFFSMASKIDCDVIIAGAGPAGASAGFHLAKAGLRVIIADWQSFPRDKTCGDFVSAVAVEELNTLGFPKALSPKYTNAVRNASVYLDGECLLTSVIPRRRGLKRAGLVIPRRVLDQWIASKAQEAGAELREETRVKSYHVSSRFADVMLQSRNLTRKVRAGVLIGADGSISGIARMMRGASVPEEDRMIAVRGYLGGVQGPADRADLYSTSEVFPGYCWLFPTREGDANVGVGVARKTIPPTRAHLREVLLRLIATHPALNARVAGAQLKQPITGWPLTTYNDRLPISAHRVILVGDAAGLIDPLNGEGIQYALLSGRWAAATIIDAYQAGHFSGAALKAYDRQVKAAIGEDLIIARALLQLICNRSFKPLWLNALRIISSQANQDPQYARVTGGVLAGILPARDLLQLRVIRGTLQQAAVMAGARAIRQLPSSPADILQLGIQVTQAAIEMFSPILPIHLKSSSGPTTFSSTASMSRAWPPATEPKRSHSKRRLCLTVGKWRAFKFARGE